MSFSLKDQVVIDNARKLLSEADVWDVETDLTCLIDRYLERRCKDRARDEFMLAVHERCNRIPLGHIVGTVDFDGLPLTVGTGVFIPRPHSQVIHKWLENEYQAPHGAVVLDLCSGSGAIGLAIAKRRPDLKVTCVEYDDVAFQYLTRNIYRLANWAIKADALKADLRDWQAFSQFNGSVALIVANPPYVPEQQEILPEWEEHHPYASVYSGDDGLDLARLIIKQAKQLLQSEGWLVIEHGESQGESVRALFSDVGFSSVRTIIDEDISDTTGSSVITVGCKRI
ncbi:HemK family protein methyltransferase [Photorhabdus laumondii subsp. laumondii]|uniref:Photorhabdus luminescens subsp. laumondii TTO1 complete genome segment 13/17 n=2 Tax=Photorhabdus laumondii subsp. laumondii TaxID=141679 RepID=Q7N1B2_PHOLL|nr:MULTISPECIES: HemK/PrmC family methyltransferase [Photorhabdus]AXG48516.1 peptide chain release factor N(5)-glutamine methyltransferase [Photorhabdus laumondii subsp. laumondii]KTL62224.1 modification methylase hemk precursor [Photorhabdus laumondii subsp. laumondii]MCC8386054.1 peptide chain release factor N(5)-glutamine methyltransferase [Photorhabdus laumondii]MCC8415072.1 peptide chain release factor N(5)-glutamine methyltransferase [Photorhabdus laumondii]NDK93916.1 HemK family protein